MKILVLEPYYGGSHKRFLDGLQAHVSLEFNLMTLPARKWKWRMRLAAPLFAEKIDLLDRGSWPDAVFCSSFVDVATLRGMVSTDFSRLPFYTYFHENQFIYPVRREDERDFHFGLTHLTTVLASDHVAFNSRYNLETFLAGVRQILKICPDMKLATTVEQIGEKAVVLHPGVDFSQIDSIAKTRKKRNAVPVIVWNHRWEHDKDPHHFFKTLFDLAGEGYNFKLVVLGQAFRRIPAVFTEARQKLADRILHWGYVESRAEYAKLLHGADIVVSTARHEFYGISVIEAVRAGCIPLLPERLSYPELFPAEYLYAKGELGTRLRSFLSDPDLCNRKPARALTDAFSWDLLAEKYRKWFSTGINKDEI